MAESSEAKDGKYWCRYMINAKRSANVPAVSRLLKGFPALKSGESQLKLHIKTLRSLGASLDVTSERVKSNERSQQFRNDGNEKFSSGKDTNEAAKFYTQSIAYALPGSQELAIAYGNRSAVSFKAENYEDCLIDIERALAANYPDEIKAKVFARRVRCLVVLKKPGAEIEKALKDTKASLLKMDQNASGRDLVEKTLADKNHMAPTALFDSKKFIDLRKSYKLKPEIPDDNCDIRGATGITLQYSKEYGRHIVATRDIRPGEIIAVIDNYANARDPEKCYLECSHCIKKTTIGIPCDHCVNVIYCSTACRDKAWKSYHVLECPILGVLLDLQISTSTLLGMRITLKAIQEAGGVNELKKMVKEIDSVSDPRMRGFTGNVLDCTKYACIYSLASHAGKHMIADSFYMSLITTFVIYYLATKTEIFGKKHDRSLGIFDKNPLLIFLGGLMIRNCEIVQITGLRDGPVDNRNEDDVLVAPFTALCNHSCDPNIISLGDNKTIAYAIKPIKAGEQICDNYMGLHYSSVPKSQRQQLLKRDYHFTCDCVACVENWPLLDKLPNFMDIAPQMEKQLVETRRMYLVKMAMMVGNMNMWNAKDELVKLLEFLYKHACPCEEIITYQDHLMKLFSGGIDPF